MDWNFDLGQKSYGHNFIFSNENPWILFMWREKKVCNLTKFISVCKEIVTKSKYQIIRDARILAFFFSLKIVRVFPSEEIFLALGSANLRSFGVPYNWPLIVTHYVLIICCVATTQEPSVVLVPWTTNCKTASITITITVKEIWMVNIKWW